MKYICLRYIEPGTFEGMTEDERNAVPGRAFLEADFLKRGMEVTAKDVRLRQLGAFAGAEEKPRQPSQSLSVEGATSRFCIARSQVSDCSRNVLPPTVATDACNVSGLSAPLASMISLALRLRRPTRRRSPPG